MIANTGGAVGGYRIVPAGIFVNGIQRLHIIKKYRPRLLFGGSGAIEVNVLALAEVCAHAHDIRFVSGDVGQFVAAIETANGGKTFADFHACFD